MHWWRQSLWHRLWQWLLHPLTIWSLFGITLWIWHAPVLYQAATHSRLVHVFEHLCFFGASLLFCWLLVYARRHHRTSSRAGYGVVLLIVFTTAIHSSLLGALLTFAATPLYPVYTIGVTHMYVYTLLLIRLLSRRAIGQLSLIEFALVIALGSAVGDPMFYEAVPLLHGFAVITTVMALNRGINWLMTRNEVVERIVEGTPASLIQDGQLVVHNLHRYGLSQEELFEFLRGQGVENLGSIREAYFEQNGQISLFGYATDEKRMGLRIVPPWDIAKINTFLIVVYRCSVTPTWAHRASTGQVEHLGR